MRSRPRSITFLTIVFSMIPVMLVSILFTEAEFSFAGLIQHWNWNDSFLFISCFVIATAVWSVRPWGYFTSLILTGCGVIDSLVTYIQSPDLSSYIFLTATVALSALTVFLFQRQIVSPYFNPRERWWETPMRYRAQFQMLATIKGREVQVDLVDISKSGCFIHKIEGIVPGDLLNVHVNFLDIKIDLMTKVVRGSIKPVNGLGLMFVDLTRADRKDLGLLLAHLLNYRKKIPTKIVPPKKAA